MALFVFNEASLLMLCLVIRLLSKLILVKAQIVNTGLLDNQKITR